MRKAKIICTLGPSTDNEEVLRQLILNGMNCARLNFSHGTLADQKKRIDLVKKLRAELKSNVSILLDTKGPEIRLKDFEQGKAELVEGGIFTLSPDVGLGNQLKASISYPGLAEHISLGTNILIDDGKVSLKVEEIRGHDIICRILVGGVVSNHKSINIPGISIPMPYINAVDYEDLIFGIKNEVDFVAASFIRNEEDVMDLRRILDDNGGQNICVISKIENEAGIQSLSKIIAVSDGIMVARGDMGVELPFIQLPAIQKNIIHRSIRHGCHTITATQMLESMTTNPTPTRAEVSDVANAIFDGSTAVMLSGETAVGRYPVEALVTMSKIVENAEANVDYKEFAEDNPIVFKNDIAHTIAQIACVAAANLNAKAIVVLTRSGKTATLIANYRPTCTIIAAVVNPVKMRHLSLTRAVHAINVPEQLSSDSLFSYAQEIAIGTGMIEKGDKIVIVAGSSTSAKAPSDMLKVLTV
ncbi:pyruvate kinase [Parasporobacterium paucivorans]|uniref:Pyruvate kinase n=1 Tax=Parasporobacterium paucivorans DSM 15970 TaxID=1122934 RepID=A0A1M6CD30_9FIRM|nr:pyruvate kinase [Parasporobacterium paucivorans]SHI58664.1 pyruvate kinase [Parasporobacterium paucivorans DSM 15970]